MLELRETLVRMEEIIRDSEHLCWVAGLKRAPETRSLEKREVDLLEKNRNLCSDWTRVRAHPDGGVGGIHDNRFEGEVVIGRECSIYRCVVLNCVVGNGVRLENVGRLRSVIIEDGAEVRSCSEVSCDGLSTFGNGIEIPVAIETGGREVFAFAEMTFEIAASIARHRDNPTLQGLCRKKIEEYVTAASGERAVIGKGSRLHNSGALRNVRIGPGAVIDGARSIENTTVLSSFEEPGSVSEGAVVKNSILQWGCEVSSLAIVENSLLCEHSHVERHGKVFDSILGPNTGVSEGEVTASLVGPFVGFHHQALLIAAFWPEGKGNIAYGANVGSNHTGKAPDQEIWPGEGTFFGLGCSVKYPSDFSKAPYSILATGVMTLPQKVEFPFSLINSAASQIPGISPAYNEIRPGWMLSENMYAVRRSESKFKKRNKARREAIPFEVFRPEIVDLMIEARTRLRNVDLKKEGMYTDRNIPGLGKNFLLEEARVAGIAAYSLHIGLYGLRGLLRVMESTDKLDMDGLFQGSTEDGRWKHERVILLEEFDERSLRALLEELIVREKQVAEGVRLSKERDDKRGVRIIEDYGGAHIPAEADPVVLSVFEDYWALEIRVKKGLDRLSVDRA